MLRNLSLLLLLGITGGQAVSYFYKKEGPHTAAASFDISVPRQADGEKLFKQHCASCHSFDRNLTGPNLIGIFRKQSMEHWEKYMSLEHKPKFPTLTDSQMKEILAYVKYREVKAQYEKELGEKGAGNAGGGQSMRSMIAAMENKLNTLYLNGDQDNDYLVTMMVLNYQVSKKMSAALDNGQLEMHEAVRTVSAQQKLFTIASGLLKTVDPGAENARIPITTKTETTKSVERMQMEMKVLSQRAASSSNNPAVVRFAERSLETLNTLQ